eukprot:GHVP01006574.1.p1 GENE.GHVP01006574.1~~GHVP01006574.1.p1  ORF type:complete len:152 (+),score=31.49 GHVP01006574.1:2-457(+)
MVFVFPVQEAQLSNLERALGKADFLTKPVEEDKKERMTKKTYFFRDDTKEYQIIVFDGPDYPRRSCFLKEVNYDNVFYKLKSRPNDLAQKLSKLGQKPPRNFSGQEPPRNFPGQEPPKKFLGQLWNDKFPIPGNSVYFDFLAEDRAEADSG